MISVATKTNGFFDSAAVIARLSPAKLQFYKRSGALTWKIARNSIRVRRSKRRRRGDAAGRIGQPPVSRTGFFKKSFLFAYDSGVDGAIVGPSGGKSDPSPAAFEFGGIWPITVKTREGRRRSTGRYQKFPTMGPALDKAAPSFSAIWSNLL